MNIKAEAAAFALTAALSGVSFGAPVSPSDQRSYSPEGFPDATGVIETFSTRGRINNKSAFFQSLGTNGRTCGTCHLADQAFGLSAADVRVRFEKTHGRDPLFAPVDGANCPTDRQEKRSAHSLLLGTGLIRIGLTLSANAQFTISVIHDPYGCAITPDPATGLPVVSVYRRPLPTTNLTFLSAIMFDGRETIAPLNNGQSFLANLVTDLTHQAIDATNIHAQGAHPPTAAQLADIVNFELGLFTAQGSDRHAGSLTQRGAQGAATHLASQQYYPGMNDSLGADPTGEPFDASAMTLFASWAKLTDADAWTPHDGERNDARRAIAAGETLFNTFNITITNVRGLNDNPALGNPTSFVGHCTSCHDTPDVGNHSLPLPLDIGTGHTSLPNLESDRDIAAGVAQLGMPNLPVFLINGCPNPFNHGQPVSFYTTDPGKALVTGLCSDVNRVKGPVLRGLAARAPYFHNGAAESLQEVVNFYNERFKMELTVKQKAELIAFLNSL
jgi:cytochrome c peroxidase